MRRSLSARLRLALVLTAFASVALTAIVSVGLVRSYAEADARAHLRRVAAALGQAGATEDPVLRDPVRLPELRRVLRVNGDELAIVTPRGLSGSPAGIAVAQAVGPDRVASGGELEGRVRVGSGDFVYVAVPAPGPRSGAVLIARPISLARGVWLPVVARVLLAALAAVLLAAAASTWLAARLVRPVRALSAAARRVARGDLSGRVPAGGDDELGELATSFNEMTDALVESQRREREFLASVSHELRTPLTAIRGYTEALEDEAVHGEAGRAEALAIIAGETDRLERLVRDVMDLARLGTRSFGLEVREVDLGEAVRGGVAALESRAQDAGVALSVDADPGVVVRTDPDRVRQVVANLVENALRVTDAEGSVRIAVRRAGDGATIEIADTGPGIAEQDLPHVFERGYLWRQSRGNRSVGSGLGLAIVRELVAALGGSIGVRSEVGRGSAFRVTLPSEPPVVRTSS